jgi:hypothetical protein
MSELRISTLKLQAIKRPAELLKTPDLAVLRVNLLNHLRPIDQHSLQGQAITNYLASVVFNAKPDIIADKRSTIIINVLRELGWIKCYYRAVKTDELESLRSSQGTGMIFRERAKFSPTPNNAMVSKYRHEDGYSGDIIMIPTFPGGVPFVENESWPCLKQSGQILANTIWFLPLGLTSDNFPLNARRYYDQFLGK